MSEFGYEPVVVTGPGDASGRWVPRDDSLQIPSGLEVHRARGPEPPLQAPSDRKARWLGRETAWSRWWLEAGFEIGLRVGKDVDAIHAAAQPYTSLLLGERLARALGKPWLAELGDPWALDEMVVWPSRVHRSLEARKMRRVLSSAGIVAMSTPEAARRVSLRFPELASRVRSVPWGYEPGSFDAPRPVRNDDAFRIVHTGHLHTDLGRRYARFAALRRLLGGRDFDVDVLGRSHVYLLRAIELLQRRRPELRGRIELHLAGVLSADDLQVEYRDIPIKAYGHLEHSEAVALMRSADLLFLPMHALPEGRRATIIPGKTYEYLAAEPPILAAVPEGDARDLINQAGGAHVCQPDDVDALAQALEIAADRRHRAEGTRRASAVVERYTYRNVARELAAMVDDVAGTGGAAAPGYERLAIS
jgi:glycosyltransferase involved in cell wall biosynthesis